jgi:hypothetical protein
MRKNGEQDRPDAFGFAVSHSHRGFSPLIETAVASTKLF